MTVRMIVDRCDTSLLQQTQHINLKEESTWHSLIKMSLLQK